MGNIGDAARPSRALLAGRLKQAREQLFDDEGLEELARELGLPARTWLNYESGVTIPGEILLRFVVYAKVNPAWLIDGVGRPFIAPSPRMRTSDTKAESSDLAARPPRNEKRPGN